MAVVIEKGHKGCVLLRFVGHSPSPMVTSKQFKRRQVYLGSGSLRSRYVRGISLCLALLLWTWGRKWELYYRDLMEQGCSPFADQKAGRQDVFGKLGLLRPTVSNQTWSTNLINVLTH